MATFNFVSNQSSIDQKTKTGQFLTLQHFNGFATSKNNYMVQNYNQSLFETITHQRSFNFSNQLYSIKITTGLYLTSPKFQPFLPHWPQKNFSTPKNLLDRTKKLSPNPKMLKYPQPPIHTAFKPKIPQIATPNPSSAPIIMSTITEKSNTRTFRSKLPKYTRM